MVLFVIYLICLIYSLTVQIFRAVLKLIKSMKPKDEIKSEHKKTPEYKRFEKELKELINFP